MMKKLLIVLICLAVLVTSCDQAAKQTPVIPAKQTPMIVVPDGSNVVLNLTNFVRIQKFILDQGQRQTYCNKFNNNPYWSFSDFNAYLNPPDQRNSNCQIGKSDFNILVFQVTSHPGPIRYWDVHMNNTERELRIIQYYSNTDPMTLIKEVSGFFEKALAEIDKQGEK